jgi:ribosomal protein S18 acetylase RimI-like enzyme
MPPVCLHNRDEIEAFLRRNPALHLYELGDLDDFFWPYTTWYALRDADQVQALALLYTGTALPVLLAFAEEAPEASADLLRALCPFLPRRFYAHLSLGLDTCLGPDDQIESHGVHLKMALADRSQLAHVDTAGVVQLTPADRPAMEALYQASYPGNWFDPRMLETDHYVGIWRDGELVSVAGVHVYSPRYSVAALGNITTHPRLRGQGLATRVTGRLCQMLLETVGVIGLNVKKDNEAAIRCYEGLGFEHVAEYEEFLAEV